MCHSYTGAEAMGHKGSGWRSFEGQSALDFHPGCVSLGMERGQQGPRVWLGLSLQRSEQGGAASKIWELITHSVLSSKLHTSLSLL